MKKLALFTSLLTILATSTVAYSKNKNIDQDLNSPFLKELALTSIPVGHSQFCSKFQNDCAYRSDKVYRMRLTSQRWEELLRVNSQINQRIKPQTDMEIYAVDEYWTYPTSTGDCEDYALLKRKQLIELGWHPSTVRLTVVLDEKNEGHAILTVATDRGDLVLDNVRDQILLWKEIDYTFIKRQSGFAADTWVSLRTASIN